MNALACAMITEGAVGYNDYMDMGEEDRSWLIKTCQEIQEKRDDEMKKASKKR